VLIMKRLNITLPEDLIKKMGNLPNKSHFIAVALKEKLERIKKEELDRKLIEGYKATRKEDKKINEDWEKITLEGWK